MDIFSLAGGGGGGEGGAKGMFPPSQIIGGGGHLPTPMECKVSINKRARVMTVIFSKNVTLVYQTETQKLFKQSSYPI